MILGLQSELLQGVEMPKAQDVSVTQVFLNYIRETETQDDSDVLLDGANKTSLNTQRRHIGV
jgi:elongation factor P--beta-lysine ligase